MFTSALLVLLAHVPEPIPCSRAARNQDEPKIAAALSAGKLDTRPKFYSCSCDDDEKECTRRHHQLGWTTYTASAAALTFKVRGFASVHGEKVVLVPFASAAAAEGAASAIRKHPVTAAAFQGKKLRCVADGIPGHPAWLSCAEPSAKVNESTGWGVLSEAGFALRFFYSPADEEGAEDFGLQAWSFPAAKVPKDAPGWAAAKDLPEVVAFLKAHPKAHADFYRKQTFFLVLWVKGQDPKWTYSGPPNDGPGLVINFETGDAWYETVPGAVRSVATDLKARPGL